MLVRRLTLAVAALAAIVALPACGGGADELPPDLTPASGTASATPAGAASPTPRIGPSPALGGYVTLITPNNGQILSQLDTQSPNPSKPRGVCFQADFKDLEQTGLWFRMAVDDKEVTVELVWLVTNRESPTGGRACFAPPEGLKVGRHTAAVSVQNPSNAAEPPRQIVAWAFDVTP